MMMINFPLSQNAYGGMKSGTLAMACLNDVAANRFVCGWLVQSVVLCLVRTVVVCFVIFLFFHPARAHTVSNGIILYDCYYYRHKTHSHIHVTPDRSFCLINGTNEMGDD